jgi:hypothetical protein
VRSPPNARVLIPETRVSFHYTIALTMCLCRRIFPVVWRQFRPAARFFQQVLVQPRRPGAPKLHVWLSRGSCCKCHFRRQYVAGCMRCCWRVCVVRRLSLPLTSFIQIQPIKAACLQAGTCLHLADREENSVTKFFDFESCVNALVVANCCRSHNHRADS